MLRIGLTGGIGSGKSTVANLFAALGVPIVDTDDISRDLVTPEKPAYAEIVQQFGNDILDKNRKLDRAKLRERVFDNAADRARLEMILHPRIRDETHRRLALLDAPYAIAVVPLLTETNVDYMVNRILLVDCDEALQVKRTVARSGLEPAQVRRIMAAQASRTERITRADDVIENNAGLNELKEKVARMHERYLAMPHP
jgi:dephospho-CoA kinase